MPANTKNFFPGVGRRKTAAAQVRLRSGRGDYTVNELKLSPSPEIKRLFELVGLSIDNFEISVVVRGGGMSSREDAILLGIARALVDLNPDFRSSLRKAGYLTRDARVKERKKPGLKRARRAPQWAKR